MESEQVQNVFFDKSGNRIEELMSFDLVELNKSFLVYSINDNEQNETMNINFAEVSHENDEIALKPVIPEEKELIINIFQEAIKSSADNNQQEN